MTFLDVWDASREAHTSKKSKRHKNIENMVCFYNQCCNETQQFGEVNFTGCMHLSIHETNRIIKTQKELEASIRKDASRFICLENLPNIDWDNSILVGNSISSGACGRPSGLDFTYNYAKVSNTIYWDILYDENPPVCRALSKFDYWLLLPCLNQEMQVVSRIDMLDIEKGK